MKTNLALLFIIVVLTAALTYHFQNRQAQHTSALYKAAPEFNYVGLSGKKGSLPDHKGKVILVHFWATWCPPCIVEFPDLIKLAESQNKNFIVLI